MCKNTICPSRKECYRFRAIPNEYRQSYSQFKPDKGDKKCDYFIGTIDSDKLTKFKEV